MAPYFVHLLQASQLVDLDPMKLKPTWTNRRIGEDRIAKRLDRFVLVERMLSMDLMIKQWVDSIGDSDHMPICLEILRKPKNPASLFKLCVAWIINEDVLSLIQSNWIPYIVDEGSQVVAHLAQNMAHVKTTLKSWANTKKYLDDQAIIQIEAGIAEIQNVEGVDSLHRMKKKS